jgi:hypothetical protein
MLSRNRISFRTSAFRCEGILAFCFFPSGREATARPFCVYNDSDSDSELDYALVSLFPSSFLMTASTAMAAAGRLRIERPSATLLSSHLCIVWHFCIYEYPLFSCSPRVFEASYPLPFHCAYLHLSSCCAVYGYPVFGTPSPLLHITSFTNFVFCGYGYLLAESATDGLIFAPGGICMEEVLVFLVRALVVVFPFAGSM